MHINISHVIDIHITFFQLQLRDTNERLHAKLDQLQGQFGNIATTKTDLSAQLLMTEEEKLKVRLDLSIQKILMKR